MKDYLKNPLLYYILIPVILLIWVVYSSSVALPNKHKTWREKVTTYEKVQPMLAQIATLAPERVIQVDEKTGGFDYDKAINKTAQLCRVSASNITPNIRGKMFQGGQEIQDASISLNQVGIRQFSMFLSISLHLWPDLQCERLKLTRIKGPKDKWKADMNFRYFY